MTAQVFSASDWLRARAARAQAGKAPRLSITRTIALREHPAGERPDDEVPGMEGFGR